jgi:hypothetical protein
MPRTFEKHYKKVGGRIKVIVENGKGHYPLSPEDPKPVVDFITSATASYDNCY